MNENKIFVSDLSSSNHVFSNYHFCRGNSNSRKTRIGIIKKGSGTYSYFNKSLSVSATDIVFIPENIYCYSEWKGTPEIEVTYISCFLHFESFIYEPQTICVGEDTKENLLKINELLSMGYMEELEAYSLFYKVLQDILPQMKATDITFNKTLWAAIEYITSNWNIQLSISDLAKKCCVSESTLYHLFQKELGQSPISFLNSIKINNAINYLENTNYSVSTISGLVGFNSENHFRKVFTALTNTTPLKFRKKI